MANISCDIISCDNNVGFGKSYMISIDSNLINAVKQNVSVCPIFKDAVD